MKRILLRISLLFCLFITGQNYLFAQLQTIDFETATGYTTVELANNINQYWKRVAAANEEALAGTDDHDLTAPVTGFQGLSYFASEDVTVGNTLAEKTLITNALSVTASHNLEVRILVAAPGSGYDQGQDYLIIEYTYNGSSFTKIGQFSGNNTGNTFQVDADMNGIGDGTTLTTALTEYIFPIPKQGTSLQIRVRAFTTASGEEIVFDNLRVFGVADATAPTVTVTRNAVTLGSFAATTDASVSFNLAFSETLDNGTIAFGDVAITNPGGVTITAPSAASLTTSDNQNYTYSIAGISAGDGALSITVGPAISDIAGNPMAGAIGPSSTITIDNTAPRITTIIRQTPATSPTNADALIWDVTFDEAVSSVDLADFSVTGTTATISVGVPTGNTYPVTVSGGNLASLNATVTLTAVTGGLTDAAGNTFTNATPTTTNNNTYVVENTAPRITTILRQTPAASPTNADALIWDVTFDEAVSSVDLADFSVTGTTATISVGAPIGNTYPVTVSGGNLASLNATVTLTALTGGITDAVGNAFANATPTTTNDNTYLVDNTAPRITTILRQTPASSPTNANTLIWNVTFDEAVTGVDNTDFSVTGTTATISVGAPTGNTFPVTVSGGDLVALEATVTLSAVSSGLSDAAGNTFTNITPTTTNNNTYVVENTAPRITTILRQTPATSPTNADALIWDVTFDEAVSSVDLADFSVTGTTATISVGVPTGNTYPVTVSGGNLASLNATVTLTAVTGGLTDAAGNTFTNATPTTTNNNTFLVDNNAPTVTILRQVPLVGTTNATSVTFRITFNEDVNNVDIADFVLNPGNTAFGTLPGAITTIVTPLRVFDITITAVSGNYEILNLDFNSPTIADIAGNAFTGTITTEEEYIIDNVLPTVSPNEMSLNLNGASPESIVFSISEELNLAEGAAVTGFSVSTATTFTATYTGKGTTNTITLLSTAIDGTWTGTTTVSYSGGNVADRNPVANGMATITNQAVIQNLINLAAGDIAFTSFKSDNQDKFSFVLLKDIASGTKIKFTDMGWTGTAFRADTKDGTITWTATTDYFAGLEVVFDGNYTDNGGSSGTPDTNPFSVSQGTITQDVTDHMFLSTGGDQLFAFQGDATSPTFLAGIHWDAASWDGGTVNAADKSQLPAGLSATTAFAAGDIDNGAYFVYTPNFEITSGTVSALRTNINAVTNWDIDDNPGNVTFPTTGLTNFTLPPDVTGPFSPATGSIVPANLPNLVLTYNSNVAAGTSTGTDIQLYNVTTTSTIATWNVGTPSVTIAGATVTINPGVVALVNSHVYQILIAKRVFVNADGNGNTAITGTTWQFTADAVLPTVTSVVRKTPLTQLTNLGSVVFTVNFSENVTGITLADFSANTGSFVGTTGAISVSAASGSSIDVTINTVAGNGTLGLNVLTAFGITDGPGNALTNPTPSGLNETYTIDQAPPVVTSIVRTTPAVALTNATTVVYTVTFNEDINAATFTDADLTKTLSGVTVGTATITETTATSGIFTVSIPTVSGNGTVQIDLLPAASINDVAGSGNDFNSTFNTGQVYTIDQTLPTVTSIVRSSPTSPTNATSVVFTVSFSEDIDATTFTDADLTKTIVQSPSLSVGTATIVETTPTSGVFTVTIPSVSGDGTIRLDLLPAASVNDMAGNDYNATFNTGQVFTIDNTPPTYVSITRQSAINGFGGPGATSAISTISRLTFSEDIIGIEYSGANNNVTGVSTGVLGGVTFGSFSGAATTTTNFVDITLGGLAGEGIYSLRFFENDDVTDLAGNPVNGAGFSDFYWNVGGNEYYTKVIPEPTNDIANLNVTTITSTSVTLQWNSPGSGQAPTHFLVMAKPHANSYPLVPGSEDGNYIPDGTLAKNIVRSGGGSYNTTFNLTSGINYDFIIYPYTLYSPGNPGSITTNNVNYKTNLPASTLGLYPLGVPLPTAQASTMALNTSNVSVSSVINNNTPGVNVLQFRVADDGYDPLSSSVMLFLNSTFEEKIIFNISEELTLTEGASVAGFSTSTGSIASAIYSGKGTTNTITLTSSANGNWTSSTTVAYTPGNMQGITSGTIASIAARAVVQAASISVPYSSNNTFTVPAGVTIITVEAWGAGGGAGSGLGSTCYDGGGGGGGGSYSSSSLSVTPSTLHTVTVGIGGTTIPALGAFASPGSPSIFGAGLVVAPGGSGGQTNTGGNRGVGGAGGGIGTGNITFAGGSGSLGIFGGCGLPSSANFGGGGGSSAGTNANGISTFNQIGALAPSGGGNGGSGIIAGTGQNGFSPGGGAGASGNGFGGNGANGQVIVTYEDPTIIALPTNYALDNSPFRFNQLVINQLALAGNSDPIDDWTQVIDGAELSDGTASPVLIGTVGSNTITFGPGNTIPSTNPGDFGFIPDAVSSASVKDYTLKIWLKTPLSNALAAQVDNLILGFAVASGGFSLDPSSSRFTITQPALNSSNAIDVDATALKFQASGSSSPTNTNPQNSIGVGTPFSASSAQDPAVYALDANNNLDLDYEAPTNSGTITNTLGLGQTTGSPNFVNGVLSLNSYLFTTAGTNTQIVVAGTGLPSVSNATSTNVSAVISNATTISDATVPASELASFSSLITALPAAYNFDFTVTDDVGADAVNFTDNDALPTLIQTITITQDANNGTNGAGDAATFDNWTLSIDGAQLTDGTSTVNIANPSANITGSTLLFNVAGTSMETVANNGSKTYQLRIWLKNPVDATLRDILDNKDFAFAINQSNLSVGTANTTSTLAPSSTSTADGRNVVTVTATKLDFITQWTTGAAQSYDAILTPIPTAKARDVNQNLDIDWSTGNGKSGTIAAAAPATYPLANSAVTLTNGVFTFDPGLQVTSAGGGANGGVTSLVLSSTGLTNGTTNTIVLNYSANSDIVRDHTTYPFSHPTNILYAAANNQINDITSGTGIAVEQYTIRDGGGSADTDGTDTKLSSIVLNIENYQLLRRVALYDGATEVADLPVIAPNISNVTATNADMTFSGITNFIVSDDLTKNLTVKVSFNSSNVTDNTVINFRVVSVTGAAVSSSFIPGASTTSPVLGIDENKTEVVASRIDFTTQPHPTNISTFANINSPYMVVEARDVNANRDLDYNSAVGTISNSGTTGTGPGSELLMNNIPTGNFVNGVFSFQNFDIANSPNTFQFLENSGSEVGQLIQLTVPSGALTAGTSSTFQVIGSFESWMYFDPTFTYTTQIDFVPFQNATTSNTSLALGRVILSDGGSPGSSVNPGGTKNLPFGSHNDLDGGFTKINDFTISLTNSADIRAIGLYTVGGALIKEISNPGATVTFNTLSGFPAPDNDVITYVIRAEFKSTIIDQHQITMQITNVTPNSGSKFPEDNPISPAPTIAGISGGDASPSVQNILNVIATSLDFEDATFTLTQPSAFAGKQEPIDGSVGTSIGGNTGIVYARDKFGLIDTDFNNVAIVNAPALPITFPNVFVNGKLDLVGMKYQNAGDGTLNVTSGGLDSDVPGVGNIGNSTPSITVDVIHVTATDDQTTVEQQPSLKGGTTNKRIFGVNFFAEHTTTSEPELSGFSFIFREEDGDPYPYTKSATDNVYKNFKLFVAEGSGAPTALTEGSDYTLTPGQTVALSSTNPPADYKDKLTFVLTNPVPLYQSNYRFYLNVDVDVNVSVGTAPITPYLIDLGYSGPNTNGNILTSIGSSSTITDDASDDFVKGITRKFASTKPPVLVSTTPSSGTLNVDPDLNTISLKFDVSVVSFDGVINVYNRETGTLRAIFTSTNGKYVDGPALKDQVVPILDFAAPVGFNFKSDTVYYVTIEKGVFSNIDATQRKGISDEGFNLYGGISYSGTFYFKGASQNPPVLSGTDASKYYFTPTTATFNFKFNEPGKVHYMVVHPTIPAAAPLTVTNAQILGNTPYTTSNVIARGTATIDQLSPNLQFATINANLTNNVDYYVYAFAENDAQPVPISTASPYGSSTNNFGVGTAGPTIKIKKTSANTGLFSNPRFEICPNSSVKMEEPIIISEAAGNNADFSSGFNGGSGESPAGTIQSFNILLPTGFQFDVTKNPTIALNGGNFGTLPVGTKSFRYRSSTLLEINFINTGGGNFDNIIITNLYLIASALDSGGDIIRFGGNGLATVPDDRVLARITSGAAPAIPFTSSYDNSFSPWPYTQIANALPYKPVTYIPDNFASIVKLIPDPPIGDYGSSFFSGSGLTNDELTLSAVTVNASFNITLTHTDQNGCATTTVEQYLVYDHSNAIPELLEVELPGVSYNIKDTKVGLIPGAPDPVTNIPGSPTPTFNVNDLVSNVGLAGYQLIDLFADIPVRTKNSGQVLDYDSPGWAGLVNSIKRLNTSYPDANLGQTFKSFNWEYSNLINKNSTTTAGVEYPYDPSGRFARIIQSAGTGNGKTYFEPGSLGIIEFTGVYQSTADFSLFVPFRQEIELFIPAVPIVEVSGESSKAGETAIFCESGLPFTVIGYPLANSSDVTGFFTLKDSVSGAVIVDPGFVDNDNGTATYNPTSTVLKNGYKTIKIEYTFQQNNSPAVGKGTFYIRVTPNPLANFITSTRCEDIDVVFTDTTLDPIPGDVKISEWLWSFGDASSTQNSDIIKNPKHVYSATGLYANVNLRVKTNYQCASVSPKTIDLEIGGTPKVDFTFNGVSTADPINFTNGSTVSTNDSFAKLDWTFGDGTTPQVVTSGFVTTPHTYTLPKSYDVNLKVTSTIGCVNDSTQRIVVLSRATPTNASPYIENFETANGMWQASSLPTKSYSINPSSWVVGTPTTSVIKIDDPTIFGSKVVKTSLTGTYRPREESAWYSPSFDISQLERPMVSFNSFTQMEISDGVVLQYSIDNKNVADPSKVWWALGEQGEGVDWFNAQGITAKPGNQPDKDYGWSTIVKDKWVESKHALENVAGKDNIVKASRVVFRFALGSAKASIQPDGFALDNFRLGERTRTILLENFTSTNGKDAGQNTTIKNENAFINTFESAGLGTTVVKLNYHIGFTGADPFNLDNPADPSARALYYNVKNVPYAFLDGGRSEGSTVNPAFSSWGQKAYDTQTLQLGQADINISTPTYVATEKSLSLNFNVQVKALYNLPDNTILHVAVIEESILASSLAQAQRNQIKTGETTLDYVLKKMLPNASGTKFGTTLAKDQSRTFTGFEYYPDPTKLYSNKDDLAIIVFLQNEDRKDLEQNIYQTEIFRGILDPDLNNIVTSLENSELLANMEVYPNPANSEFTIQLPGVAKQSMDVQLVDQVGKVVTKDSIKEGTSRKTINSQYLAAGIYILQIGAGKSGVVRKKILIVHQD